MAEEGAVATGEDGGEPMAVGAEGSVTDRVDAAMEAVEAAGADLTGYGVGADAGRAKLGT